MTGVQTCALPISIGNAPIADPDAIVVDIFGDVSGTQGDVIVGGVEGIFSIATDGTVTEIYGNIKKINNPTDFAFDASGRLVFTDWNQGQIRAIQPDGSIWSSPTGTRARSAPSSPTARS